MFDIRHHFTASLTYLLPGKQTRSQLLDGWSINSIVLIQSGAPWAINDLTTDFSGTNEINNPIGSNGEQLDFFGNPSDFQTRKSFNDTNGCSNGECTTGIPYYPGASNATCLAQSTTMGLLAVASLTNLGCYANRPRYGSYGATGNNISAACLTTTWICPSPKPSASRSV